MYFLFSVLDLLQLTALQIPLLPFFIMSTIPDAVPLTEPVEPTQPRRERRPSVGAPIGDLQGPVGPGFSRPKHKRTFTGLGPAEIKNVEASIPEPLREA